MAQHPKAMSTCDEAPFRISLDVYFVFGGPGAGKGTICSRLSQDLGLAHICVGDLLREAMQDSSVRFEAREQVEKAMREGELAPIQEINSILQERLLGIQSAVLLDGFPRSLVQMGVFEHFFCTAKYGLLFSCSRETMERRVLSRGQTSNRDDDNLETLRKRFAHYEEETVKCIDRLRERNTLVEFDCDGDLDAIYESVKSKVQELLGKDVK